MKPFYTALKYLLICLTTILLHQPLQAQGCWKMVSNGALHTLGIKNDGTLWAWGDNRVGQIGDGTNTNTLVPKQIGTANNWKTVGAGTQNYYSIAIRMDGSLWAWGYNYDGQLGDGTYTDKSAPVRVGMATDWAEISVGGNHTLAKKNDGSLWAWGAGGSGALGGGISTNNNSPVQIGNETDWANIAAGAFSSFAIKTDGSLWAWGSNNDGQLGDGTVNRSLVPIQIGQSNDWAKITSQFHTLAIKKDGTLWAWGDNQVGQLGDGTTSNKTSPVQIGLETNWKEISSGWSHSLAIKTDGSLWAWGDNSIGELGDGTTTNRNLPTLISTDFSGAILRTGSYLNSMAIKSDGTLFGWGWNGNGQLGDGTNTDKHIPTALGCPISAVVQVPTISSFSPTSAGAGSTITFTGTGFTGAISVNIGGWDATSFNVVDDNHINAIVDIGSSRRYTSYVRVVTPSGGANLDGFTYIMSPQFQSDSLALVDLFNSTNGANWTNKTNWLTSAKLSSWYGFNLDFERVLHINLSNNNLNGSIPSSFGNLTELIDFELHLNQLTGSLPSSIGNLTKLTRLDVAACNLTGTLPSSLGNLTELTYLALHANQFTGSLPASLGNLTKLQNLVVSNNKLSGALPASLGNLTTIADMALNNNNFTDPLPLSLKNLGAKVHFSENNLSFNSFENFYANSIEGLENYFSPQNGALIVSKIINGNTVLSTFRGGTLSNEKFIWNNIDNNTQYLVRGDSTFKPILAGRYTGFIIDSLPNGFYPGYINMVDTVFKAVSTPVITSFSPSSASIGSTISVTGTSFIGTTSVTIGGIAASNFIVVDDSHITFTLGNNGVSTGNIAITTAGGVATSGNVIIVTSTDCIVTIPDANFKAYLVGNPNINTNGDAEIQCSEAAAFSGTIDVTNYGIANLSGIEAFTSLKKLFCGNNSLISLDVSQNTALTFLSCNNNIIINLDVSHNTALTNFSCQENSLTSLDVSNNNSLIELYCHINKISSLDVSHNTLLTILYCQTNKLSNLDVSANISLTTLVCGGNNLSSLNINTNTALTTLSCGFSSLSSLDLTNNTALTSLDFQYNNISSLDVSHNTQLSALAFASNNLSSIDVSANTKLSNLDCRINQLTSLDVSHNKFLTSLYCGQNSLTNLNIKNGQNAIISYFDARSNPNLSCIQVDNVANANGYINWTKDAAANYSTNCSSCIVNIPDANFKAYLVGNTNINTNGDAEIQCSEAAAFTGTIAPNQLGIADLTGIEAFTSLTELICQNNNLTSVDISHNTALTVLSCGYNSITSIDVSHNTAITRFQCDGNKLTSIDVSRNTSLTVFTCSNNNLTNLDVSHNLAITTLLCGSNNLINLNVSHNTALTVLDCDHNNLTSLDISTNTSLTTFNCETNSLTSLNIKNGHNDILHNIYVNHNPTLSCIQVDNVANANGYSNWRKDAGASYNTNCPTPCTVNIPDANFKAYLVGNTAINTNGDTEIQCSEAATFTGGIAASQLGIANLTGIEAFTSLTELICQNNNLTSIDISHNTALIVLSCGYNSITSLDVSHNTAITRFQCEGNKLTSIDVSYNTSLIIFSCTNNNLTNLDVSYNTALTQFNCDFNNLTNLDVSHNTALTLLSCYHNNINSLDVSPNTSLTTLDCQTNSLTSLNIKNGKNNILQYFYADQNPTLSCIQADNVANANGYSNWRKDASASYNTNCSCTPTTSTTAKSICASDLPYVWNGLTFTASGSQTAHLTNVAGCDSAATLNLTVKPKPNAGLDQTILCGSTTKSVTLSGILPTTGAWSSMASNNTTAVLGTTVNGVVDVTLPVAPFTGKLSYIYTATGCLDTVDIYVNGPISPTIDVHTGAPVLCNGSTVQLCPKNWGYSNYQWYKDGYAIAGATGVSSCITIDASGIGSYTLAGTNGSSCWSQPSAPLVVSTVNSLSKPTITVTGATALCNGGSAILTSSSANGNQWFKNGNATGVTTQAYTVTDPADYSVLVTNGNCASAMSLTTTISGKMITPASFGGATTVVAGSTTQLTSGTSNGLWTSNNMSVATVDANGLVKGITAGTATITYTVSNSCGSAFVTQLMTVTTACVPPVASFTVTGASTQCLTTNGVSNSFIFNNTNTGTGLTYTWYFGDGSKSATTPSATHTYSAAGKYTVTLRANNGCGDNTATNDVIVTDVPATPASVGGATTVVVGSTTQLTSGTSNGQWTSSNMAVATVDGNSGLVTGVMAGTATITYTVTNSCGSASVTQPMTVTTACIVPFVSFTINNATQCLANNAFSFTNTSTGTGTGLTYTWYFGDGSNSVSTTAASHNYSVAGPYTVSLTATNGCGSSQATNAVTVNTVPATPASIGGATTVVAGSTTQLTSGTPGGSWTSNSPVAMVSTNGLVTGVTAGSATITYTVTNGCGISSVTQPMTVTTACVPTVADFIITNATQCLGNSFTFTNASTGTIPTYTWYFGDGASLASNNATHTYLSAGPYTVTLTAVNACGTTTKTSSVTVNAAPATPASIGGATTVVAGSTTQLTSGTPSGAWTSSNSLVAMLSTNGLVTGLTAGSATITYTVTNGCGISSVTQPMTVTTACVPPVADFTITNATQCLGNSFIFTNASTGTAPTYKWYFGDGVSVSSKDATHTYTTAKTYNVLLTVDNACGSANITKQVTVNGVPATPASIGGATTVVAGSTTQLTSGPPNGQWTSNSPVATVDANGLVRGVTAGTATITYMVSNSCGISSVTQPMTVTTACIAPVADFSINSLTQCLSGNSFTFTNNSTGTAPTYKWYFGDGGFMASKDATHLYTTANTYNVLLTLDNACGSASITKQVTVNGVPATPASIGGATTVVAGSTTQLTSGPPNGQWTSNSPVATVDANGLVRGVTAGTATITYMVSNSCGTSFVTQPMTVTTPCIAPVADFSINSLTQCLSGNSFTFTNNSTGTAPTYKWYFGDGGFMASKDATHLYTTANTYNVLLTVDNACGSRSITKQVTVNGNPATSASINGTSIVAVGATTQLSSRTSSGVWTSNSAAATVNSSTGLVTGVSVGSATITYTVTNGCGSSSVSQFVNVTSASVTVSPNPATTSVTVIFTAPTTTGFVINIVNSSNALVSTTTVATQSIGSTVSSSINVFNLPNGTYFISIYDTQGHLISTTQVLKS